jgi:hypothetical protein
MIRTLARLREDSRIAGDLLYAVATGMPGMPFLRYVFGAADCEPIPPRSFDAK